MSIPKGSNRQIKITYPGFRFRYSSPLSRAMGCQSLLLYAGGGLACLLPALSMADADAITCLLQGGQP